MLSHVFEKRKYIFSHIIYKFCSAANLVLYTFTVKVLKLDVLLRLFQHLHPRMANICINDSCHMCWSGVKFCTWPLICIQLTKFTWVFPKIAGFPPKSSILIYKPSILGEKPLFLETPTYLMTIQRQVDFLFDIPANKMGTFEQWRKKHWLVGLYRGDQNPIIEGLYKKPRIIRIKRKTMRISWIHGS